MRVLTGKKWREGFLDYHRNKKEYRIQVLAWKNLERLENVYHTRAKSLRLLMNYLPVVGPEGLITKTWSRIREERRNEKYISCGIGKILETADDGHFTQGEIVAFVAPWHPALAERIVLPEELILSAKGGSASDGKLDLPASANISEVVAEALRAGEILYLSLQKREKQNEWWKNVKAWSVYSGIEISAETRIALAKGLKEEIYPVRSLAHSVESGMSPKDLGEATSNGVKNTDWSKAQKIDASNPTPVSEINPVRSLAHSVESGMSPKDLGEATSNGARGRSGKKSGVLYGYGNYAKINIIPYTKKFVDMQTVHEIDPTQIFMESGVKKWDSSPFPKQDEKYDVYFVASYNHTHVPITLHALSHGAYVLVEKPVVMDYDELKEIETALRQAGRKLFIGFHKRYGIFNKMALKDLGVEYGEPISYHSIVYELIQPEFFWYNWPVSRSTFLSNGCHQIDHFFHLNNWSKPKNFDIKLLIDGAVEVWIELENGATMTTTFSEKGSLRVGPRDHVELKVHGRNVRVEDQIKYMSEDNHRIIRKMRIFKTNSYKDMYQTIGRKIANNEEGDSIESVLMTSKIMLDLEEKLEKMKGWGDRYTRAKREFRKYFF